MKVTIKQVDFEDIDLLEFDAFVAASGYESRASFLAKKIVNCKIDKKYCMGFNSNNSILSRNDNDFFFNNSTYIYKKSENGSEKEIFEILDEILKDVDKDNVILLIDYSSMTSVWYSAIISYFKFIPLKVKQATIYFSYSHAVYSPAINNNSYNREIAPIKGFSHVSIPDRPTALVIGLGYEKQRAFGLIEYFDAEPFVLYSDSSNENLYSLEVEKTNKELLARVKEDNIFTFPMHDLIYIYSLLENLCENLLLSYRVILAPCGPKPFTLLSLLISTNLNNVDVWRISGGKESTPQERSPNGNLSVLKVDFLY